MHTMPLIDHGAPTFFISGAEVDYIGNGLVQGAYYRMQRGDGRIVECRMVFHLRDLPALRKATDAAVQTAHGNERAILM